MSVLSALEKLETIITRLRQTWPALDRYVTLTAEALAWRSTAPYRLDLADFTGALAQAAAQTGDDSAVIHHLTQAQTCYRGELLPRCGQDWVVDERQRLHAHYIDVLTRLTSLFEGQGNYAQAVDCARILQHHNHLYAALHQRLTHWYVLCGSRAAQLRRLEERLAALRHQQGALVLIQGVAGIGKSSLALACAERIHSFGVDFAVGHCYGQGVTAPFMPWQEALAALTYAGVLQAAELPEPFGHSHPVQSAQQLIQSVAQRLLAATIARPLVLLLDDLHWADQDSLDLLDFVTRPLAEVPLLILATYRSEEIHRDHPLFSRLPALQRNRPVETIHLTPLTLEDTSRLLEAYHGPCTSQLVRYLHTRAEGHPLFLVQLLDDLVEQKLLVQDEEGHWQAPTQTIAVPTYIQQVIIGRIARLGPAAEQLLTVAAVIGESWDLPIVETLLAWPEEQILAVLENALTAGVIRVAAEAVERYRFTHGLIREVLYNQPLARRRKQLHARVAAILTEHDPTNAATLAHHYFTAEQWRPAWHYSVQAGADAQRRQALHSAVQFYRQALSALQKLPDVATAEARWQLYEGLGNAYKGLNHQEDAEVAYTHMVEWARRAAHRPAEGRALFLLAITQTRRDRADAARTNTAAALRIAEELNTTDPHLLALRHQKLGQTAVMQGDLAETAHHAQQFERYGQLSEEPDLVAHALRFQGHLAIWAGHYTQAEQLAANGIGPAHAENASILAGFAFVRGFALIELGRYAEAQRVLQEGLVHAEQLGERFHYLAKLYNMLSYLHHELGDYGAALQWSQRALAAQQAAGADHFLESACYTLLDLASSHLQLAQLAAAQAYLQQFDAMLSTQRYSAYFRYLNRYQLLQAEVALARGDLAQVFVYTRAATALAREKDIPKNLAKSAIYEGQALLALNRPQEAATHFQDALILADRIEHAALRWQSRLRLAAAYAVLGQPNADLYDQALAIVAELAANLADERLRSCFLASPLVVELKVKAQSAIRVPAPQPATSLQKAKQAYAGLTRREREVAALIAAGKSNRAIAEALVIGERTVEGYVSSILSKLDFTSRAQIAAWAVEKGLRSSSQ